ncbi:hypothetical protein FNU76_16795 [Chitinimonas arctica]|uniref:Uncharacterized protein n=1 Tax=Chitinimonas arctica TaxID=2594795 RepID=A0A516SI96_9NEIS|nr:hypothetical protein [Chitinimonas arctica]QDQ27870.1 hypothetical protein FNU76_16795 [Chitinimonas arctica]
MDIEPTCDGVSPANMISIFGAPGVNVTAIKVVDAIADIDQHGQLFGIEILWLKDQLGELDVDGLMRRLEAGGISFRYDEEVDILHFSLISSVPCVDKTKWVAELAFEGAVLSAFYLKTKV